MDSFLKAVTSFKDKIVKTPLERLVHDACTDENWGVANTSLHQISDKTHNSEERSIIMRNIWELLSSPSKEWRRLYKVLNLLDHLLKFGSLNCVNEIKDNIFKIKMFQDFSFREGIEEKGIGVRDKAKYLTQMISDSRVFDEEREKAQKMWNKMSGSNSYSTGAGFRDRNSFDSGSRYEGFGSKDFGYSTGTTGGGRSDQGFGGYRSEPASAGLRNEDKREDIRSEDIFKQNQQNKYSLWDAPSIRPAASPSNGSVKSLKPPTGFHPSNVQSKPTLTHSQSVSSTTFDLLFEAASPHPSSFFPLPQSTSNKAHSPSGGDLLSMTQASPSAPSQSLPLSQGLDDLLFHPIDSKSLHSHQGSFPSSSSPPSNLDFSLPSNLFTEVPIQGTLSKDRPGPGPGQLLLNTFSESSGKKLNVNLSGGTSMDQMKTFNSGGFSNFSGFVSAPTKPVSLESKLFNLDDLEAGQPKAKEVVKNKW